MKHEPPMIFSDNPASAYVDTWGKLESHLAEALNLVRGGFHGQPLYDQINHINARMDSLKRIMLAGNTLSALRAEVRSLRAGIPVTYCAGQDPLEVKP